MVFSMWWIYFKRPMVDSLTPETAFVFGYVHYFVFASVAAVGACLAVLVDVVQHHAHIGAAYGACCSWSAADEHLPARRSPGVHSLARPARCPLRCRRSSWWSRCG